MIMKCEYCEKEIIFEEYIVIAWYPRMESMVYFCTNLCYLGFKNEYPMLQIIRLKRGGEK